MSEQELTDLEGMDWDIDGGYWYSVANGDVSPERLLAYTIQLEAENAALKQALTLIGDIGYDYDGYGTPHDLKKLIDEMVGYARNPQSAVDVLTAEEQFTGGTTPAYFSAQNKEESE